ncbi:MAG: histone deacetylase, partial [Planctomycetes bacterium]|nr:histone deacetylase [Planctomycetota bacterium]
MHVFYCDPFAFPLPPQHRFPLAKYRLLRERVLQLPAGCGAELVLSPRVARDELLLVHDAAYVDDFVAGRLSA